MSGLSEYQGSTMSSPTKLPARNVWAPTETSSRDSVTVCCPSGSSRTVTDANDPPSMDTSSSYDPPTEPELTTNTVASADSDSWMVPGDIESPVTDGRNSAGKSAGSKTDTGRTTESYPGTEAVTSCEPAESASSSAVPSGPVATV